MRLLGKNFCDISPTTYKISQQKEIAVRHIKNRFNKTPQAKERMERRLPNIVSAYSSHLIKRGPGIDLLLQQNKAVNIRIACTCLNGLVIKPGEEFSFWRTIGKPTAKRGFKEGRILIANELKPGLGGGLCNLANTIHYMALHSPLTVTEFHSHSDALAPEEGPRVPFSSGTAVDYNYIDYRFRNDTNQKLQLMLWCDEDNLYGQIRSEREFPWKYKLVEKDHHFQKEGDKYFRVSRIYRLTYDRATNQLIDRKLVRNNHSEVMYDYDLIPKELIR